MGRVVVEVEHLACDAWWAGVGHALAVVRMLAGGEHHESVEAGRGPVDRPGHLAVPEFECTAPLFLPGLGEVEKRVDAAMCLQLVMPIEVRVDLQEVTRSAEMDASADEVRIGNQVVDSRQRLHEEKELAAVELAK